MNYLNGGYAMLKHNATQTELANAYKTKKPILLYDENGFAYWAKINETTSIVDDETIYTYDVVKINQIENLIDNAGNPRFIEGDGVSIEQTGINITYCKWSLSGTHLMFVIAGDVDDTTAIANAATLATFNLPDWIMDKIYPVWIGGDVEALEMKQYRLTASDWSAQTNNALLSKETDSIKIKNSGALTLTADRGFRIQFDLLIDNDYSE